MEWKYIIGYENLYQVSNNGEVKSVSRIDRCERMVKERILKPEVTKKGYLRVSLGSSSKGYKKYLIHRLVALAFIPNPNNLLQINHKDENKLNNNVNNLEWCNNSYNHNYGKRNERATEYNKKRIIQLDTQGNTIAIYKSIKDAALKNGINRSQLSRHLNNKPTTIVNGKEYFSKSVGGYKWAFYDKN